MVSCITKVVSWKTPDGRVHATERSARLSLAEGNLFAFIRKSEAGKGCEWTPRMIADWIVENSCELAALLNALEDARKMA